MATITAGAAVLSQNSASALGSTPALSEVTLSANAETSALPSPVSTTIDSFRNINGQWTCALASAVTDAHTGICLLFFAGYRGNKPYLDMIESAREMMSTPPQLLLVQGADPVCRPLMMQLSISADSLPQLFITDLNGIIEPGDIYTGLRTSTALSTYLKARQASVTAQFQNPQHVAATTTTKQDVIQQAAAYSSI